jgi:hypothetical protein
MPFIQYFDSFEELNEKIDSVDYEKISDNMKSFNIKRKNEINSRWKGKLDEICN